MLRVRDSPVPLSLVIAHPGHELRVFGHLERHAPVVHVLTDGSGHTGRSRLWRTAEILRNAGARQGSVFGRFTDGELYAALLQAEPGPFVELARGLAEGLSSGSPLTVAADAAEGFNPGHDVCRLVVNAAVGIAAARGAKVRNLEFPLDGAPDAGAADDPRASVLVLDDDCLARKLEAARGYAELGEDVGAAIERFGIEAFRTEVLAPASCEFDLRGRVGDPPFYERHGEARVREGFYGDVVRFCAHVEPLARALEAEVAACASS
jgi:hypothetical protein